MQSNVKRMILIALFSALMVAGAYIRIPNPFFPVFFTFQGVVCAYAGLLLGSKNGAVSVGIYVLMGLIGLPVFSGPSGPQYVLQPTFGFLPGFILAAWVIGKISERATEFTAPRAFFASFSGLLAIYLIGIHYMLLVFHLYLKNPIGYWALISSMALYFVKDLILFILVAISSVQVKKRILSTSFVDDQPPLKFL